MDFTKLVDAIKIGPRYLLGVALATGVLVWSPNDVVASLGLTSFRDGLRSILGGVFLISTCLLAGHGLTFLGAWIRDWSNVLLMLKRGRARLRDLTLAEREILAGHIRDDSRTQYLSISDGTVRELESERIIRRASSLGTVLGSFAYNLQPWAWRYLRKHAELVGVSTGEIDAGT